MERIIVFTMLLNSFISFNAFAQEKYGKTLNLGLGIGGSVGYYSYVHKSLPVININYEFDIVKNLTIAPFISITTYTNNYFWGNANNPGRYYTFRETIIPIGAKGAYYFDDLLKANKHWDFYLAGSLGIVFANQNWDNNYNGDKKYFPRGNDWFLDVHVGTEYHFNNKIGAFLDLSTGVSTLGLAIHGLK
jgi:hypothetical protein